MNAAEIFHESLLLADDADKKIQEFGYTREYLDALSEAVLALPLSQLSSMMAGVPPEMLAGHSPQEIERLNAAFQYWLLYLKATHLCDELLHDTKTP